MADFEGKIALITGGARGMGRSHALALAEAGADIALCDRCENSDVVGYPLATEDDLAETVALVEATGRKCIATKLNVTDRPALESFVAEVEDALGGIDIAIANAGVSTIALLPDVESAQWDEVIGTNLTGTFNTISAVAPGMIKRNYGRIITVSSMLGHSATWAQASYVSSKWGVIGLTKVAAHDLVGYGITVNAVAPGNIETPMTQNDFVWGTMRPDLEKPTLKDVESVFAGLHLQYAPFLKPEEVTRAVLFLAHEGSSHITGTVLPIDAGATARMI
ncbi:mycofactocin-coupled SDR family oxidoreductase [Mycobacterium sp. CBMA271]|uniref:mycofactocin-coupled SDR family oxidoreductase n=1 Tax=unclassified Mycobacteroides TaxID=2618759 RepID=UPI00132AE031|nr:MULTISPECIES: mycofactocin-coupled SDR family oxidoreductase [unclassified Mycobacteroides]MUM16549.1 3-ketoacyl-ACP reductase [Mycobacteroides sp. CBMA 326]MUM22144.1 mycofactocin-coupled SDR family oxidoreductase [Mycobacteroides sp. CBMA 271]